MIRTQIITKSNYITTHYRLQTVCPKHQLLCCWNTCYCTFTQNWLTQIKNSPSRLKFDDRITLADTTWACVPPVKPTSRASNSASTTRPEKFILSVAFAHRKLNSQTWKDNLLFWKETNYLLVFSLETQVKVSLKLSCYSHHFSRFAFHCEVGLEQTACLKLTMHELCGYRTPSRFIYLRHILPSTVKHKHGRRFLIAS